MSEVHMYVPFRDMNYGERKCTWTESCPVMRLGIRSFELSCWVRSEC